jgi:hypothetical protein
LKLYWLAKQSSYHGHGRLAPRHREKEGKKRVSWSLLAESNKRFRGKRLRDMMEARLWEEKVGSRKAIPCESLSSPVVGWICQKSKEASTGPAGTFLHKVGIGSSSKMYLVALIILFIMPPFNFA